ncbi:family 10 glycosylhydrolase [Candidatus Pantoea persica]|uniref:family 10 glycosylhydrolase n=1 Tax=Candidatus Pantoea persica TaxID=2518128 RepID=UPI00215D6D23|nr:family 10 glycosylhydrolase [Candidatus Pantoea persica]MBA2814040.1 liprotein, glycosyl hydrolase-like protein [Candidatus Pantoea persica]
MRGVWLVTVSRLDWPPINSVNVSSAALRIRLQQQALTAKLDRLKSLVVNTVFFQVKPDGAALWRSASLPWSDMLTGAP